MGYQKYFSFPCLFIAFRFSALIFISSLSENEPKKQMNSDFGSKGFLVIWLGAWAIASPLCPHSWCWAPVVYCKGSVPESATWTCQQWMLTQLPSWPR